METSDIINRYERAVDTGKYGKVVRSITREDGTTGERVIFVPIRSLVEAAEQEQKTADQNS